MLTTLRRFPRALALLTLAASTTVVATTATSLAPAVPVPAASGGRADVAALQHYLGARHTSVGLRAPGTTRAATSGLSLVSYYNWGGYANDNTTGKTYNLVSASWTQPKVVCPKDEDRMAVFWVGLDGFSNSTVEQDGSGAYCSDGTALYFTWWEMYPTNSIQFASTSVAPGDKITASVSFAGGTYTLQVRDATTPANSFTHTATCASDVTCANASAEWIAETPGTRRGQDPWPNFGTWKLTGAKVKSGTTTGTITTFPDDEITLIGSANRSLGTTSALTNGGKNFSVKWNYAFQ